MSKCFKMKETHIGKNLNTKAVQCKGGLLHTLRPSFPPDTTTNYFLFIFKANFS